MVSCNLPFIIQIISIVASVLGIICAIYSIFAHFSVGGFILNLFAIVFCLILILVEIHIFDFYKYLAFMLTFWGKGIMFLFMGFLIFSKNAFPIVVAVIFWCLFALYVISFFFAKGTSAPLLQKGCAPSFELSSSDFYGGEKGNKNSNKVSDESNKDTNYYKEDPEN